MAGAFSSAFSSAFDVGAGATFNPALAGGSAALALNGAVMLKKNTAGQVVSFRLVNASTGAALTGATVSVRRCLDGTFGAAGGTVTEDSGGLYKFAPTQADTNADLLAYYFTATSAVPEVMNIRTTAADLADTVRLGLTALPNATAGANTGLPVVGTQVPNATAGAAGGMFIAGTNAATTVTTSFTTTFTGNLTGSVGSVTGAVGSVTGAVGSVTGNVGGNVTGSVGSVVGAVGSVTGNVGGNVAGSVASVTAGVTVATNNDKTGYSLSQSFPTNFSSLAITAGGAVTAGTVSDKTGYSLSQSFPANFSSLSVDASGHVTLADASLVTAKLGTFALAKTTNITGFNDLSAAQVNAEVDTALADAGVTTTVTGRIDAAVSSRPTLAQILAGGDVDGYTLEETLKLCLAALAGKLSGAAGTTVTIRSADDTANRLVATVDADGNRSSVTLNAAG